MQLFRNVAVSPTPASAQHRRLVRAGAGSQQSLHICTSKTCRRQGSPQILKFVKDLGLEELGVEECGCLGNCGKGPNMVLMPGELRLRHVSTPADVLGILCSLDINIEPTTLQATELRLAGNALAAGGELEAAISKYQEALALSPQKGQHMLYSNLSVAYLQLGRHEEALQAAKASVDLAPKGFHMAHVRYVDALYASGKFVEAAAALHHAVEQDLMFKTIPDYKVMQQALKKYMQKSMA
jgi:hypothetical protein